jgi:hypothetical protein
VTRTEEFEQLRPLLFSIAYRILSSVSEAEDAVDAGRPRFETDRREREELAERFFGALREGNVDGLRELLATDVSMVADSGGKAPQWARGFFGAVRCPGCSPPSCRRSPGSAASWNRTR